MELFRYPAQAKAALESLRQPYAVFQLLDGRPVPLILSDGLCELYRFSGREQAAQFFGHGTYAGMHPEDRIPLSDAALRFFQDEKADFDISFRIRIGADDGYRVLHAHGEHITAEGGARLVQVWYMDEGPYAGDPFSAGAGRSAADG